MDNLPKQRLVGALILIALGVVFWPIIFVPPNESGSLQRSMVPPAPVVDTSPLPKPTAEGLRGSPEREAKEQPDVALPDVVPASGASSEDAAAVVQVPVPTKDRPYPTRDKAPEKPQFDADGIPIAWVLQVATVSSREKAAALRDELIAANQKAFFKPLRRDGDTLFRVFIGPKFERAQLQPIKSRIDDKYGVNSLVARYVP